MEANLKNSHPGLFLKRYFLDSKGWACDKLAKSLEISGKELQELLQGKKSIDVILTLRLGQSCSLSAEFWMYQQARFDLQQERCRKKELFGVDKVIRLTA